MASDTPETRTDPALRKLFYQTDKIPLVYWRRLLSGKTSVLLTGIVAIISFITGLSHLSREELTFGGPIAPFLPPKTKSLVLFTGVLLGFVLGGITLGLHRRKRVAWYGAVVALAVSFLLPLVTAQPTDALLFFLSVLTLPAVVRDRGMFDQRFDLSPIQIASLTALLATQVYGTVGAYALRNKFTGINTWTDAFYYIVVTGTTVGYGDATPNTQGAKLFTLSVLVVGTAAFGAVFGSLLIPALEARLTSMTDSELTLFEDHILLLGYGDFTEPLLEELAATAAVVVVTPDTEAASKLRDKDVTVLTADPTNEASLLDARIDTASGVVAATEDDAQDTLAVLAARQANPDIRIVAAATNHHHVDKLEHVGADEVISPTAIVGRRLGRSVIS